VQFRQGHFGLFLSNFDLKIKPISLAERRSVTTNTFVRDALGYSAIGPPPALQDSSMNKSNSSMQLTRAADYAIRVMIHLASLPAEERALLPTLARATGAPESFLSKVLQALAHAGLVASQRGQAGGFAILPRGRDASMLLVIEAIDGPLSLNTCLVSDRSCSRQKWCPAHPVWVRAQQAMLDVLSAAMVADLASSASSPQGHQPMAGSQVSGLNVLKS
jgi:Rrf2 family protein